MMVIHYEVYVLEGRGWMLHARHPRSEREGALTEAKELEQALRVRAKVVRETYYTEDNSFEEAEIYITGGKSGDGGRSAPSPSRGGSSAAVSSSAKQAAKKPAAGRARRPHRNDVKLESVHSLIPPLIAIVAVSLAASFFSVRLLPEAITMLWKMGIPITLTADTYSTLLMSVFVGVFLLISVPLGMRYLVRRPVVNVAQAEEQARLRAEADHQRALRQSLDKLARDAARSMPEPEPEPEPEPDADEKDEDADSPPDQDDTPPDGYAGFGEERADKPEQPEEKPKDKDKAAPTAPTPASMQPTVTGFLNGAIAKARQSVPTLDSYNKFALHLYMAGAVEALCDFKKMGSAAKSEMVSFALEGLGTRGPVADKFYEKLDDYLLEPRYLGMVQAGRDAMSDFMLGNKDNAHGSLKPQFEQWNKKADTKHQIMTVMFTDMVGSTDMTQARGDSAAQEIVRKHNSIVRGALAQYGGKEIKHTGDGIMASFSSAAGAVEATVAIQKQVRQHNARNPNQDLHLRIGLNAGEPIQEEDDLFGATIQLAARVCAATDTDQILCTSVVKDLSANKGAFKFRSIGERSLKGFKDSMHLYEVEWR